MKVLVIGGAGFLGSQLCEDLLIRDYEVVIYDKMLYSNLSLLNHLNHRNVNTKVSLIQDCTSNIDHYPNLFKDVDLVYYLSGPRLNDIHNDEQITKELNYLGQVLESLSPNTKFIFTSSCSVYGKEGDTVNEFSPTQITSKYSKLKITSEDLISSYKNPNWKIVRLATLYGLSYINRPDLMVNHFIKEVLTKDEIELYDPSSLRPHLYVKDASTILCCLGEINYDEPILNIGTEDNTLTKNSLVRKLNKIFNKNCKIVEDLPIDSRNYNVSFKMLGEIHPHNFYDLDQTIKQTGDILNTVNASLEPYNNTLKYYLPHTCSPTLYFEEEGRIGIPKSWGSWNVIDEDGNFFNYENIHSLITPTQFDPQEINYQTLEQLKGKKHLYIVNVFDPQYFQLNKKIGLKCVNPQYIKDFQKGNAHLIFILFFEGYSGMKGNKDFEIIEDWIKEYNIEGKYVHYVTGNLIGDQIACKKGISFNIIPHSDFDCWIGQKGIPDGDIDFNPSEQYLFLSYSRNPRFQRILLCSKLLEYGVLDKGKVSLSKWKELTGDILEYKTKLTDRRWIRELKDLTPLLIENKDLTYNLAHDLTIKDYEDTFISIVNETLTDQDTLFLSEKIWKPIAVGHPFMVVGNKGTLAYLKKLGYQTFDKWIDESYDEEEDEYNRIEMIVKELKKLNNLPLEQLLQIREEMKGVLISNKKLYRLNLIKKYDYDFKEYYTVNPYKPLKTILKNIWRKLNIN